MADTIRTEPTEKKITHHVSFSNGGTELGLVLCNGYGNPSTQGIRQGKMPNRSLQISQGDPDYSDMELPYTPITQKDWSGGRGQEDFEKDKTRYSDSHTIDAMMGEVMLGPKPTVANDVGGFASGTPIDNTQQDDETTPNPFTGGFWSDVSGEEVTYFEDTCTLSRRYPPGTLPVLTVHYQTRATRFQYTDANPLMQIKLKLSNTSKVTIAIREATTVDISTDQKKKDLYDLLVKLESLGTYEKSETFDIVKATTLTEYTFDFNHTMVEDAYYWLIVRNENILMNDDPLDFDFSVGTNDTPSTYEFRGVQGFYNSIKATYSTGYEYVKYCASISDNTGDSLAYSLIPLGESSGDAHFFTLRNTKFVIMSPSDGSAPKLYMEGYHGYAAAANTGELTKIHARNIGAEADGCIVKLVGGPGSTERTRWREIDSVTTGASGYLIVDPAWKIVHTTSTEFAVIGTETWTEITGHGLTTAVTDVMVVNDIVYFAQGESVKLRRMTCYNNSGAWAFKFAEEDYYATFMELIQKEDGTLRIWRALATASTVSSSAVAAWQDSTAKILSFGSDITCGNTMYRINGLVAYGTPRIPYVLKEDGFGAISNDIYDQVPLAEFAAVADDNNGRANLQRGVYLYLTLLNGVERYYEGRLDDIGPNRDLGLPNNRNGVVSSMLAYPGRMYASIDHPTGYSAVLVYNDVGWHEIYRSSLGARIYTMDVQVLDGDRCDRLWIAQEGTITWLPIAIDPKKQDDYTYNPTGSIETSWINSNFKEIKKYFSSIEIFSEGLTAGAQYVRISYKVDDDDDDWTEIDDDVDESPSQEIEFPNHAVYGKRIKIKLVLYTTDTSSSPRIKGITIKPVTRLPLKKSWSMTFRVDDSIHDLQGIQSELDGYDLMAQLESWADSNTTPTPLLMNVPHLLFNNKYVFIEPESLRPIQWITGDNKKDLVGIGQLTVYEA